MARVLSNAALAAQLGLTERRVYAILKNGTTCRDTARKLARARGGEVDDYWRTGNKRGRRRAHPFHDFMVAAFSGHVAVERSVTAFFKDLQWKYALEDGEKLELRNQAPPRDFASLESLVRYVRSAKMRVLDATLVSAWQQFRIWRVERLAADKIAKIKEEEDFDFG
jgi:hypothetical protein